MRERTRGRELSRDNTFARRTELVLRNMILDGEISQGERLNEVVLAAELGISRGPLREAVQRLASEGLLTVVSHRGSFVRTFKDREIVGLYQVRAALETYAVRLVCRAAREEDYRELDAMLDETQTAIDDAPGHAYPRELDFHLRLVYLAGNEALTTQALAVHNQLSLARSISAQRPVRARAAVVEHREIVDAIKAVDMHAATDLLDRHIEHGMHSALEALRLRRRDKAEETL
jgi:DNA-binding GntR family transcriptional regulator